MKETSLYIHIPFCKQKCFYCDFPSFAGKEKYREDYIEALCKEILDKCQKYKIKCIEFRRNSNVRKRSRTITDNY